MVLDGLGIRHYFEMVIDHDQVTNGKPDPEILFTAATGLGVEPARCVVVEDSVSGFKAAENANMAYIVITAGADATELEHARGSRGFYEDFTSLTPAILKAILG